MIIFVDGNSIRKTSVAAPTIYDFKDINGTNYYFRLRHGGARIENEDTEEVLISGEMDESHSEWTDVVKWAKENDLILIHF